MNNNKTAAVLLIGLAAMVVTLFAYLLFRNHPPELKADHFTVPLEQMPLDVLRNDRDADNDSLKITSVSTPEHGQAILSDDKQTIMYVVKKNFFGTDRFEYSVSDGENQPVRAKVSITVPFTVPKFYSRNDVAVLVPFNSKAL